jgi:cytochrome c553
VKVTPSLHLSLTLIVVCSFASLRADDAASVTRWDFGSEAANNSVSIAFEEHGAVSRDQSGPRPPEFPDFDANNTAIRLDKKGAHLSISDPGVDSRFDFANGDAITLEAWLKVDPSAEGFSGSSPLSIVSKGRTGNPKMARDNQNWAMRLVPSGGGEAKIGFLFSTGHGTGDAHWHRWTSNNKVDLSHGWHHVAVSYRFGEPQSIRGWINGKPTEGKWDMGGETTEQPVVDNDDVWIGSGTSANSFVGFLDAIAVHRVILSEKSMIARFNRVGGDRVAKAAPAVMPVIEPIPEDRVLVSLADGLPKSDRWLNEGEEWPKEEMQWIGDEFLLARLPRRYDAWGIRDNWKGPLLMRVASDVELPSGNHRLMLRARGLGRLWVDGVLIAETGPVTQKPRDGEQPITLVAEPPLPGLRAHGYHQQEVFGEVHVDDNVSDMSKHRVVLELVVGGSGQQTSTGEVSVAVQFEGTNTFEVLKPTRSSPLPLTDIAVEDALSRIERSLSICDDNSRRTKAASMDSFWSNRHELARQSVAQRASESSLQNTSSEKPIATEADSKKSGSKIDQFIADKISKAIEASSKTDAALAKQFHGTVLPILRDQCFRCHGEKEKGGLKLDSRESVLRAGESELVAVVPGKPEESELIEQVRSGAMPPTGSPLSEEEIQVLENWIRDGAVWPAPLIPQEQVSQPPIIDEESFLRRAYLDTIGLPPTYEEAKSFLSDKDSDKREKLIDRLLADERVADNWISYWQDILAENPSLLNQSLNSTGPFRWFLYDSLRDNKPIDRMVTELILMRGSAETGGSAGFAQAGENDSPFAAKGHIIASAFLGIELQCARCHDSPYHSTKQSDLYSLAAMLERKSVKVPATSRVPEAFFEKKGRESLIKVTMKPDEVVEAKWPFEEVTSTKDDQKIDSLTTDPKDTRDRFAALVTAPSNSRFAKVIVNRVWKRLIGAGIVEPVDDWEGRSASHPEMLEWLADDFITHDYDIRHLLRTILTSTIYQRQATGQNLLATAEQRFFNAPDRRRLTAEQIVDSLFAATGNKMDTEELTFVHDGQRPLGARQNLGRPTRAWMFASLNNERDRPSLALPRSSAVVDVLEAFGWTGSRQKPITNRETDPNVIQPGILSNGLLVSALSRAAKDSDLARMALQNDAPESLVDELFYRVLVRKPKPSERETFVKALSNGFQSRALSDADVVMPTRLAPLPLVTWFNHLQPEANMIQQENERRVKAGPSPEPRLATEWRTAYEDFVWSLINHREFVWVP